MLAEEGAEAGVGPGEVSGSARRCAVVFRVDQLDELVTLDLSVRTQVAVVDEPRAHIGITPCAPKGIVGIGIVVTDKNEQAVLAGC